MVKPTTWCPCARSMAATVEESTPPDIATAMVLELSTSESLVSKLSPGRNHRRRFWHTRSFGAFHLDSTRADCQHLIVRHEEQPIVVSLVRILQIIGRPNHEPEIVEDKRRLQVLRLKEHVTQRNFLKTSNRNRNHMTIRI